jgi:predicted small lipoprotein YifL
MKNSYSSHSNKNANALLKTVCLACFALGFLVGCGQRGALYLPTAPEAGQRSSIVETLTLPTSSDPEKNSTSSTRAPMTPPASK